MQRKLVNIGYGNYVKVDRIVAVVSNESAPIKRIIQNLRDSSSLIDATFGRKTRGVVVLDSNQIILSALQPETINARIEGHDLKEAEN